MAIGYACLPLGISQRTNHGFQAKNYSEENFISAVIKNLDALKLILKYNFTKNIKLFRISSDVIPFGGHLKMNFDWRNMFQDKLIEIQELVNNLGIRVSMHPGQYTVLNSPKLEVVKNALHDIEYHNLFLESIGQDFSSKIIIHTGGTYQNKDKALEQFITNFSYLSESAKKRVVLENDDKSFSIYDVLKICRKVSIPAVFDIYHHQLNNSKIEIPIFELLTEVKNTWKKPDGKIKVHYSEPSEEKKIGSHGKTVIVKKFLNFYDQIKDIDPDIMLEVKDKDLSAIKVISCLKQKISSGEEFDLWAKYKYVVMEKSYSHYKECSKIINSQKPLRDFFQVVDDALIKPINQKNFINTAQHVWGYFKDEATAAEKERFMFLCNNPKDLSAIKRYLKKLAEKYERAYLNSSYYFLY